MAACESVKTVTVVGSTFLNFLMSAEFAYNNAKNVSTDHTPFKLNCRYHPSVSFEDKTDPRSRSRSANELANKLRELIESCCQKLLPVQEL